MVRLTSDVVEHGKPLPLKGKAKCTYRGETVSELCVLLSPVHTPIIIVLPFTGGEAWPSFFQGPQVVPS